MAGHSSGSWRHSISKGTVFRWSKLIRFLYCQKKQIKIWSFRFTKNYVIYKLMNINNLNSIKKEKLTEVALKVLMIFLLVISFSANTFDPFTKFPKIWKDCEWRNEHRLFSIFSNQLMSLESPDFVGIRAYFFICTPVKRIILSFDKNNLKVNQLSKSSI